ncbi:VOC family protein [Nitrospirillum sp. BR 11163]|uniref:VOC family protein n=1 Tax=Nitrospirillum sp. BR 11163 TaxID=3104323 RepID=UPI002AFE24B4|nr:VOC family protein [Nitrospirillum sp. BR 11163]MEA1672508.1 VOC family protein [Nitrospirillum sp. BR 11163]
MALTGIAATRDVLLQTPDLAAATAFYEKVLGFSVFHRTPTLVGLETGAFRLYLETAASVGPVLEFLVDDFDQALSDLLAAGCVIVDRDLAVPRCHVRDPQGLLFNLASRR